MQPRFEHDHINSMVFRNKKRIRQGQPQGQQAEPKSDSVKHFDLAALVKIQARSASVHQQAATRSSTKIQKVSERSRRTINPLNFDNLVYMNAKERLRKGDRKHHYFMERVLQVLLLGGGADEKGMRLFYCFALRFVTHHS